MNLSLRLFLPALALFGCASRERAEPSLQLAAGRADTDRDEGSVAQAERAVDRLATGRCLAAERCDGRYISEDGRELSDAPPLGYEQCRNFYEGEAARLIESCGPSGFSTGSVQQCADQWATLEDCSNADGPLSLLGACTAEHICR